MSYRKSIDSYKILRKFYREFLAGYTRVRPEIMLTRLYIMTLAMAVISTVWPGHWDGVVNLLGAYRAYGDKIITSELMRRNVTRISRLHIDVLIRRC